MDEELNVKDPEWILRLLVEYTQTYQHMRGATVPQLRDYINRVSAHVGYVNDVEVQAALNALRYRGQVEEVYPKNDYGNTYYVPIQDQEWSDPL